MLLKNNIARFYLLLSALFVAGGIWLLYNIMVADNTVSVCMFKNLTGWECPACGTTRSLSFILHGHWMDALRQNPLGYIVAPALIIIPFWMLADLLRKQPTLFTTLQKAERRIKQQPLLLMLGALLIILNWIWKL